eukprot:365231-Chlamydomonas_euryale.AAC.3
MPQDPPHHRSCVTGHTSQVTRHRSCTSLHCESSRLHGALSMPLPPPCVSDAIASRLSMTMRSRASTCTHRRARKRV